MNFRSLRVFLPAFASCLLTPFAGCREGAKQDGVLRVALGSDLPTLDPVSADTGVTIFALQDVVSTLFAYEDDGGAGRLVPFDASNYAWEDEGRRLVIQLRADLRWSDGIPLTACHYRDGWRRALDPQTASAMSELFFDIRGATDLKAGRVKPEALGVRCDDAKSRLEIDVTTPFAPRLLHALAFVVSAPLRADRAARLGPNWMLPTETEAGVASGSFVIESWRRDRDLTLRARRADEGPAPKDRVPPHLKKIVMPVVRDPATALALYETGELDFLQEVPPNLLGKISSRKDFVSSPYFVTYMIGFSLKSNPALKDRRLRQALALAFDGAEIPKLLQGGEFEAKGWVPPGLLPGAERPTKPLRDLERARALLKEAGYGPKRPLPRLVLAYNGGERHQLLMERAARKWKDELGLDVELRPSEWKSFVSELKLKAPDLYRYAWAAAYSDPLFFLEIFRGRGLNNFGGWRNEEYDRLLAKLERTPIDRRDDVFWRDFSRAQEILVREDPALVPVYHYVRNALVSSRVKNLRFSGRGIETLRDVEVR
mgnify:CR=1 FL=1